MADVEDHHVIACDRVENQIGGPAACGQSADTQSPDLWESFDQRDRVLDLADDMTRLAAGSLSRAM
jgi:hypothetical protein